MSATETATSYPDKSKSRSFVWSRLGSFVSILPLGVWTVNHLWDQLAAFTGATAWESAVTSYQSPISHALTLVIVFAPLVIHMIWGIQRLFSFRPNYPRYNYFGNLKYTVQRLAGIGVLFFLGAHVWLALIEPRVLEGHAEPFSDIAAMMYHHLPTLLVYILGTLGVSYHLANGLSTFSWTWGIVGGDPALKRFDVIFWVSFLLLLALSWGAVYALWSAGAGYPVPAEM